MAASSVTMITARTMVPVSFTRRPSCAVSPIRPVPRPSSHVIGGPQELVPGMPFTCKIRDRLRPACRLADARGLNDDHQEDGDAFHGGFRLFDPATTSSFPAGGYRSCSEHAEREICHPPTRRNALPGGKRALVMNHRASLFASNSRASFFASATCSRVNMNSFCSRSCRILSVPPDSAMISQAWPRTTSFGTPCPLA